MAISKLGSFIRWSAVAIFLACSTVQGHAADLIREEFLVPARFPGVAGEIQLQAVLIRPNDRARHPLAVINHGIVRGASEADIQAYTVTRFAPQANEFARRGWAAIAFLRRGFGKSEGGFAEASTFNGQIDYFHATSTAAMDIAAVIDYMRNQPYVDPVRIISVGESAGGAATLALAATPPPGLLASIVFAPGRGSVSPNVTARPDLLVGAVREFGKTSRMPLLWVSAENDTWINPALTRQMVAAFKDGGANVTFIGTPPFGSEGHFLFSAAGIPIWGPIVDQFLSAQNLIVESTAEVAARDLPMPSGLNAGGQKSFQQFLAAAPNKAFAIGPDGHSGWSGGRATLDDALSRAMTLCKNTAPTGCKITHVNDRAQN